MERGIYAASSGGLLESRRLEVIANNLANANTVGFKASRLVSRQQEFADTLASTIPDSPARASYDQNHVPGTVDIQVYTDFTPGPVKNTGNPLDIALGRANEFFAIQTPEGERYTKAGNFTVNREGNLATQDGSAVLGLGGPITVNTGGAVSITKNGTVMVNGDVAGKVRVVQVDELDKLVREEGVRFRNEGGPARPVVEAEVVPQSLEMPNVSVVESMVHMIATQRAFEGYTKSVKTINEINDTNLRTLR